jgi:hypothetical protein
MLIDTMLRTMLLLCLVCTLIADVVSAQTPPQSRRLQDVALDNGLTLADWVRVTSSKEPVPSVATGAQAAAFVRRYGPYRELLDIVWRAAQRNDLRRESVGRENAAERVVALVEARRALGDWPTLLMASAAAKAYLGDGVGANEDLRRWMALAPLSDPSRERVAEVLLSVAQKPDAVVVWLTQSEVGAMPLALRRPVDAYYNKFSKDIARARECLGTVAQYDDLSVLREALLSDGKPFVQRFDVLTTRVGLPMYRYPDLTEPYKNGGYSDGVVSPAGTWTRGRLRLLDDWTVYLASSRNIECSAPLLPAVKGKQVQFSWDTYRYRNETTDGVIRYRRTVEYLSDSITPEELAKMLPSLRMRLPADYRGRFYRVKMRDSLEWITPPQGLASMPPQSSESEQLFIEGPNFFLDLSEAGRTTKPGSTTWTLTRPEPN